MASATFHATPSLTLPELHGYAIQGLFGPRGFEDNFRVFLAGRAEIGTQRTNVWNFARPAQEGEAMMWPKANLQLVISDQEQYYTFNEITLLNRRRLVNGAERYSVFEFAYIDRLTFRAGNNPIDLAHANFAVANVAHHCKQTVLLPPGRTPKPLLRA